MFKRTIQFPAVVFNFVFTIRLGANEHRRRRFNCVFSDFFVVDLTDTILFVHRYKLSHRGL
jgi:hypothetical protein